MLRATLAYLFLGQLLFAQVCRLSVAGLNQNRKVFGSVNAECPQDIIHSAPFGNWGVTSNFGQKRDAHQFDGWCHDAVACDNSGTCKNVCRDGWYEWNSCTDNALFRAPNCTLYNSDGCTQQVTTTGVNVHGTKNVDVNVRCPFDSDGDGVPDKGGCNDVAGYSSGTNFLSLYELDPVCCDELVQSVYFPETVVSLKCDAWGCAPAASSWVMPTFYDSPKMPPKVTAELATLVNWGSFVDSNKACPVSASSVTGVSAASLVGPALAPDSIASLFGDALAPLTLTASSLPLPTSLASASVRITDRTGANFFAPLFFVSPAQINFLLPAGIATGPATVSVFRGDFPRVSGRVQIEAVAPGLFTANSNGQGPPAAQVTQIAANGTVTTQPASSCGSGSAGCVPLPIDLSTGDTFVILYGTGIRNRSALSNVSVTIGGASVPVEYAGPQSQSAGLDQVNIRVPSELKGRGVVDLVLVVDSRPANTVRLSVR